jgi:hypothetical protein
MTYRRRGQRVFFLTEDVWIPLCPKVKLRCITMCRELRTTQAELGLVLVAAAVADPVATAAKLTEHRLKSSTSS